MSSDFGFAWLDRLAHDLRGPLAPLQTAAYLLRRDDLDPGRRAELLATLDRQTQRLARMLEELDDWTRVVRQPLLAQGERCDLGLLLEYALASASMGDTPVEGDGSLIEVHGDQRRLTQLLRSLLGHASLGPGTPGLLLAQDAHCARVDVRMAGPAPDPEALAVLFEQPQQSPHDDGLGLRLMLARAIARAHDGELTAQVEDGSLVLRLQLPLAPEA